MKKVALPSILWICLGVFSCDVWADTGLKPVLVGSQGRVTISVDGGPATSAVEKQVIPMGSEITTARSSAAHISLTPGLSALMKGKTTIRLKAAEISKGGRYGEVELVSGTVVCSLKKQGSQKQKYRLVMGKSIYAEAIGTVWQGTSDQNNQSVAVLDGTVSWTGLPGGGPISLPAGSVLLAQLDGAGILTSVKVVSLVDGTITSYPLDGSAPTTTPATSSQLADTRKVFSEAVGNEFDNLSMTEKSAFLSLLFDVNKTLTGGGVAAISTPSSGGGGGGGGGTTTATVTSNNPADATSPITPQ